MTESELLLELKDEIKDADDSVLLRKLNRAISAVVSQRRPYGCTEEQRVKIIKEYSPQILDIAVYLYNRIGSEGETSHGEPGTSRTYESAGIPTSFLSDIIPIIGVL